MPCSTNANGWDVSVIVDVRPGTVLVDGVAVPLGRIAQVIEQGASGKRVRIDVLVSSLASGLEAFLDEVRAVQVQVRRVQNAVLTSYQSV